MALVSLGIGLSLVLGVCISALVIAIGLYWILVRM